MSVCVTSPSQFILCTTIYRAHFSILSRHADVRGCVAPMEGGKQCSVDACTHYGARLRGFL